MPHFVHDLVDALFRLAVSLLARGRPTASVVAFSATVVVVIVASVALYLSVSG